MLHVSVNMKDLQPLKEIIINFATRYFYDNPAAEEWRGSACRLLQLLYDAGMVNSVRLNHLNRALKEMSTLSKICKQDRRWKEWAFLKAELIPTLSLSTIKISDGIYL